MSAIKFDNRASEWSGDLPLWLQANAGDNDEQRDRLRRGIRRAREKELTPRQREVLELYFDRSLTVPQIALQLGVNRSTVSRTLRRAKNRLYRFVRYAL